MSTAVTINRRMAQELEFLKASGVKNQFIQWLKERTIVCQIEVLLYLSTHFDRLKHILQQKIFEPFELDQKEKSMFKQISENDINVAALGNSSLVERFLKLMHKELPHNISIKQMSEDQYMEKIKEMFKLFFYYDWDNTFIVEGKSNTFKIQKKNLKSNKQKKADGELEVIATSRPFLYVERKSYNSKSKKVVPDDLKKMVESLKISCTNHLCPMIGILVNGDHILVYLAKPNVSGYFCVAEVARCYYPVARDEFSRLSDLYRAMLKTKALVENLKSSKSFFIGENKINDIDLAAVEDHSLLGKFVKLIDNEFPPDITIKQMSEDQYTV
ncbi:hypothetical protein FB192DRAFT_1439187 [Mucor lusitanicus]|uniref:Uncharacterized protein n=2 Tax=Mucor circinelloides f. lusitanicus TaxID=29924 RepID=A0A168LEF1_MUCCL|nr:hypothetical protein FB192DRAFT_1439187 [Mucor lusitanicus]OAD03431.1 hypothetical protein MUCCIDRAFT_81415 [Mucor lusitanicus CBS 277.49]